MHGDRLVERTVHEQVVDAARAATLEVVGREIDAEFAVEPREIFEQRAGFVLREDALDDREAVAFDAVEMCLDVGGRAHGGTSIAVPAGSQAARSRSTCRLPVVDSTQMRPAWRSMMPWVSERPRPVPWPTGFVV